MLRSRLGWALAGLVVAAVLAGCGGPRPVTINIDDTSVSDATDTHTRLARDVLDRAANDAMDRSGDLVVVGTGTSQGATTTLVAQNMTLTAPNDLYRARERAAKLGAVEKAVAGPLKTARPGPTDIVGALLSVQDVVRAHSPCTMFITSSLMNSAADLPLQALIEGGITDATAAKLVDDLGSRGLLPNLSGCEVTAVGFAATSEAPSTEEAVGLRRFWSAYFTAAHARVVAMDVGLEPEVGR